MIQAPVIPTPSAELLEALCNSTGFMAPDKILEGLTPEQATTKLPGFPHSIAEIVAHMTYWSQWLVSVAEGNPPVLITNAAQGWPAVSPDMWEDLKGQFLAVGQAHKRFGPLELARPVLTEPYFGFEKQSVGAALASMSVHTAHHMGQVVSLRQALNLWPPPAGAYTF